jgi:hypothetical protein
MIGFNPLSTHNFDVGQRPSEVTRRLAGESVHRKMKPKVAVRPRKDETGQTSRVQPAKGRNGRDVGSSEG